MKPTPHTQNNDCRSISAMLSRLGDKWSVLIVTYLGDETLRFSQLKRRIGGISQKMLTSALRNLERDGLVIRTVYPEIPPKVEYELTDLGRELLVPIDGLVSWTRANAHRIDDARARFDETQTGTAPHHPQQAARTARF